mgnify:CR=1 FL=1
MRIIALFAALPLLAGCGQKPGAAGIDPQDAAKVARGQAVYAASCAVCHGENLESQPNWRSRKQEGSMQAPPQEEAAHTWHHPDEILFGLTKEGLVPGKYGPPGYVSDMPAFRGALSDEDIAAALSFIQSRWSPEVRRAREEMLRNRNR